MEALVALALALLPMAERPTVPPPLAVARQAEAQRQREVAALGAPARDDPSDAFYARLRVHRAASYATLPLFALQLAAGTQLYEQSDAAPQWAKVGHRIGATGVAAMFATNLVTGIPNLIERRGEPRDRGRRIFHATAMLLASAGFTATGLIAERAERNPDSRDLHRAVALTSMGVATVGYLSMLDLFRGDR